MVSTETPSQDVPSFDHRVTQCRSTVKVSVGKLRNDFQSHRRRPFVPSSITNSHWSSGMCGVGPADKTGKSVVRYCPGGSFASAALRRPEKPREIIPIYTSPYLIKVSDSFANRPFSMTRSERVILGPPLRGIFSPEISWQHPFNTYFLFIVRSRNSCINDPIRSASSSNAKWPVSRRWSSALGISLLKSSAPSTVKIPSFLPQVINVGGCCLRKYSCQSAKTSRSL